MFESLFNEYSSTIDFATVYIKEAHPTDGIDFSHSEIASGWSLRQPQLMAERIDAATEFYRALGGTSPYFVDELNDGAMKAYVSWPERVFVIGCDGRFEYIGGYGPEDYSILDLKEFLDGKYKSSLRQEAPSSSDRSLISDFRPTKNG